MGLECFCEYDEKVLGRDGGDSYADTVHTLRATGRYSYEGLEWYI